MPFAKCDLPVVTPAANSGRTAFLLPAVDPIWNLIVRNNMIKLRSRLVVPRAPRLTAVYGYCRALVGRQEDNLWIVRIYPYRMIIVPTGRALPRDKSLACID